MTKTLLLIRHGKSSWKDMTLPDIKRPLKKRGEDAAEEIGRLLKSKKLLPDVIYSSPAKRARNSAEIAAKKAGVSKLIVIQDALYMAEVQEILSVLRACEDNPQTVMLVGHNPGLEAFLQILVGQVNTMPTGGFAHLRLNLDDWKSLTIETEAELVGFWDPENEKDGHKQHESKDKKGEKKDKKEKKQKK